MALLTYNDLTERLFGQRFDHPAKRLTVTPLLDPKQVRDAAIDVRLGNEFIVIRDTNLVCVDPAQSTEIQKNIGRYQERVYTAYGDKFILHPKQLVLGGTLEYFGVPSDLGAQVMGRSSWGRLGLIIATATAVAPGFKGAITLELINYGQAPLVLYPGVVIAQIAFETATSEVKYRGRYSYPTGPEFSKIYEDEDLARWVGINAPPEI
jgi:dCTP deaminase